MHANKIFIGGRKLARFKNAKPDMKKATSHTTQGFRSRVLKLEKGGNAGIEFVEARPRAKRELQLWL
jgi:hypothetical protein